MKPNFQQGTLKNVQTAQMLRRWTRSRCDPVCLH